MPGANKTGGRRRLSSEDPPTPQHGPEREDEAERRLLAAFRDERDLAAFDELVRRTESRVRAVALAILRSHAGAEDAAQEAFLRAFRRASSYRGEGPVGAWLCRIAVRCAHDQLQRAARRQQLAEVAEPDAGIAEPEVARRAELESALRRLPEDEREALVLKEVAGMTYQEIADACGAPLGTVQSRIHRARTRLAAALGGAR